MAQLLSLAEAQAAVFAHVLPLPAEEVATEVAAGRVVAADARAIVHLPPFASSAMDGFALRAADTPGRLPVVARIAAGRPADRPLEPGEAMGIATGGVVPDGADAVAPIEAVVEQDNEIAVDEPVVRMANVRPQGGDVRSGDVVLSRGTRVRAAHVGALAAAGVASVSCTRRPRVALLATGTELRRSGEDLRPGEVYEANAVMLAVALVSVGAEVERLPVAADDDASHRAALEHALMADVVVTSGGVSVGPHDLVRGVARELGVDEIFWGVAVKPGKPLAFGVRGRTLVFGLPGNPVSSLVACELFVRPAVLGLQGAVEPGPTYAVGRLGSAVRRDAHRDELLRARRSSSASGDVVLEPLRGQESHMIVRAAAADALVLAPRGEGELAAGSLVRYLPLD
jgi:molybdopterin molybdotransferase